MRVAHVACVSEKDMIVKPMSCNGVQPLPLWSGLPMMDRVRDTQLWRLLQLWDPLQVKAILVLVEVVNEDPAAVAHAWE